MALAISYWPGRCSNVSEDWERTPPLEKKVCRVGSSPVGLGLARGAIEMGKVGGKVDCVAFLGTNVP